MAPGRALGATTGGHAVGVGGGGTSAALAVPFYDDCRRKQVNRIWQLDPFRIEIQALGWRADIACP